MFRLPVTTDGTPGSETSATTQTSYTAPGCRVGATGAPSTQSAPGLTNRTAMPSAETPWSASAMPAISSARATPTGTVGAASITRPASRAAWVTANVADWIRSTTAST